MGLSFSYNSDQAASILDQFNHIDKRTDANLGEIMFMEHNKNHKVYAVKEIFYQEIDSCQIEENKLKQKLQTQHPNLINIVDYQLTQDDNLCAKSYKLTFILEFFNQTLDKEIFNRRAQNKIYQEDEMWFFLESVINALFYLQINNIQHGDIRLNSIYLTPDNQYKITEPTLTKQLSQAEKYTQSIDPCLRGMYLAPELLYNLHAKQPYNFSCFKSDVFTLGVLSICLFNLKYCDELYNFSIMQVIPAEINAKLEQMKTVYSASLVKFIGSMLEFQPSRRPDFQQLAEQLLFQGRATIRMTYKRNQGETDNAEKSAIYNDTLNQNDAVMQQNKIPVDTIDRSKLDKDQSYTNQNQQAVIQQQQQYQQQNELKNVTQIVTNQLQQPPQPVNHNEKQVVDNNIQKQEELNNSFKENLIVDNTTVIANKENVLQIQTNQMNSAKKSQVFNQQNQLNEQQKNVQQKQVVQNFQAPTQQIKKIHSRINSFSAQNESLAFGFNLFQVNNFNETNTQQNQQTPKLFHDFSIENLKQMLSDNQQGQNIPQDIFQNDPNQADPKQNVSIMSQNPEQQETIQAINEVQKEIEFLKQKYTGYGQENKQQFYQQTANHSHQDLHNQSNLNQTMVEDQQNHDQNLSLMKSPISKQYNKAANTSAIVSPPIGFIKFQQEGQTETIIQEQYADGSYYQGQKFQNTRHGLGRFVYSDGAVYEGSWVNGCINGYGKLFYASNKIAYEGEWRNDKFHGRGTIYNEEIYQFQGDIDFRDLNFAEQFWVKFEGDFDEDEKMGFGTYYYSNGAKFQGTFCKDMANGIGTFYKSQDDIIIGEWKDNIVVNIFSTTAQMNKESSAAKMVYANY